MIQSMTGFGKAVVELPHKKITVEIKSLNSKQLDLSTRIPQQYREMEMEIRSEIAKRLERGKVDFFVYSEAIGKEASAQINIPVLEGYFQQVKEASVKLGIAMPDDWFSILLRLPDAMSSESQEIDETELNALRKAVDKAISQLEEFRVQEGAMLQHLFEEKIANITHLLQEVEPYEKERIEKIKGRIIDALNKIDNFDYDKNRFILTKYYDSPDEAFTEHTYDAWRLTGPHIEEIDERQTVEIDELNSVYICLATDTDGNKITVIAPLYTAEKGYRVSDEPYVYHADEIGGDYVKLCRMVAGNGLYSDDYLYFILETDGGDGMKRLSFEKIVYYNYYIGSPDGG